MPLERAGVVNGMQMSLYQRVCSLVRMDIEGWDFAQHNSRGVSRCDYLKGVFWRSKLREIGAWPGNILEKHN